MQARGQRQHRGRAPGQHHERARRAQDGRARGLRAAERPRQPAMNRREFLRRCGRAPRPRRGDGWPPLAHAQPRRVGPPSGGPGPAEAGPYRIRAPPRRRHRRVRPRVPPQQRRLRRQAPARDARLGLCVPRLRRRRLARHPARQQHGLARATSVSDRRCASTATTATARSPTSRALPGSTSSSTAWASPSATSTTTAFPISTSPASARAGCSATPAKGRFVDVTRASGLDRRTAFSTSALWVDFDRDGRLDLFVCNYVKWSEATDVFCSLERQAEVVLHARGLPRRHLLAVPQSRRRHLRGRHRHVRHLRLELEIARRGDARLRRRRLARSLRRQRHAAEQAVSQPAERHVSATWRSRPGWRSATTARRARAWASTPPTSTTRAAWGWPSPISTTRCWRSTAAQATGTFQDTARRAGVGVASLNRLGFGCLFADLDLDGALDLVVANGHIDETVRSIKGNVGYAQAPQLFLNQGGGTFRDASALVGPAFAQPRVGRGLACGDFDRDGDVDLLMTTNNGPAALFRTDAPAAQQEHSPDAAGHEVEPRRDRRRGARLPRRHVAVADGAERVELPVAVGAAGDVRRGPARPRGPPGRSRGPAAGPTSSRTSRRAAPTGAWRGRRWSVSVGGISPPAAGPSWPLRRPKYSAGPDGPASAAKAQYPEGYSSGCTVFGGRTGAALFDRRAFSTRVALATGFAIVFGALAAVGLPAGAQPAEHRAERGLRARSSTCAENRRSTRSAPTCCSAPSTCATR